ncbi:NAD-dependent succinate-semialdehyde dehydrogenase [Salibacterium sp. K-3]
MQQVKQTFYKNFINGSWVGDTAESAIEVINPAENNCIGRVANAGKQEAEAAVAAASDSFKGWSRQTARERANKLWKLYDVVLNNKEEIADVITLECGKPKKQALMEVVNGAEYIRWNAEEARRSYGTTVHAMDSSKRLQINKEPVGPVAAITPWNFPFSMIARKLSPALAAGCTVVLKPAEETPLSAVKFFEMAEEAGFPAGVINLVIGDPEPIGNTLLADKRIRKVTFTGSTEVGKMLYQKAGEQVKRISMELGGHAPVIVFDDCDMDAAVQQITRSKFNNTGQTCICVNRIYVQDTVIDEFTQKLKLAVDQLNIGDVHNTETDVGPLINKDSLIKTNSHVQDAVAKGAEIVTGGAENTAPGFEDGFYYQPTVLKGVTNRMQIASEETFGPVAPIFSFKTEMEAVEEANNTDYGLAAYIFTNDLSRSHRLSEELEYGMVGVNDTILAQVEGAFGGVKESGVGREGGPSTLDDFLESKFVSTIINQNREG